MPRTHIIQSWVGAAEYGDGDTYSGEQIGNRNQKSVGVHITRSGDQWYANPAAYADEKPKPSAFESIMLADRHYSRLSGLSGALDVQLDNGEIDLESWAAARRNIDARLSKAWLRVQRERGWTSEDESSPLHEFELEFDVDILKRRRLDYSIIPSGSVFKGLRDDNCLKILYTKSLTMCADVAKVYSKIVNITKEIIAEGLI